MAKTIITINTILLSSSTYIGTQSLNINYYPLLHEEQTWEELQVRHEL